MKALLEAIQEDEAVCGVLECFGRSHGQSLVYGTSGAQKHVIFAAAYAKKPRPFFNFKNKFRMYKKINAFITIIFVDLILFFFQVIYIL